MNMLFLYLIPLGSELIMPKCIDCGLQFPRRIWIEGKEYTLNNRKRCLVCSPFNQNDTTPNTFEGQDIILKEDEIQCEICAKPYIYKKSAGNSRSRCSSCVVNGRRWTILKKCTEYLGGKCQRCGYNKCSRALVFHHRNPEDKKFVISSNYCRKWAVLQAELDKCDLVCANCHAEIHAEDDNAHKYEWKPKEEVQRIEKECLECFEKFYVTLYDSSMYCSLKCMGKASRKVERPSKEVLEQLLKELTWCAIGRKYGVTDNSVRKWARSYKLIE